MRDYGKVHSTFWSSDTIRSLSEDGKLLALYLLTSPHATIAGVFRLPDGYACEDLNWKEERVSKGFAELLRNGFARRCGTTKWVWVCRHLEWNPVENPNQQKAVDKIITQIPLNCRWLKEFQGGIVGQEGDEKRNPSETLSEGLPNQEQEQEQDIPSKKPLKPRKTRIPDNFLLNAEITEYIESTLPMAEPVGFFAQFREHAEAKGWEYLSWIAAFKGYCRNARPDSGHFSAGQYPRRQASGGGGMFDHLNMR